MAIIQHSQTVESLFAMWSSSKNDGQDFLTTDRRPDKVISWWNFASGTGSLAVYHCSHRQFKVALFRMGPGKEDKFKDGPRSIKVRCILEHR